MASEKHTAEEQRTYSRRIWLFFFFMALVSFLGGLAGGWVAVFLSRAGW